MCNIHGTVSDPALEGKCIYLIALDKSIRDSVGIDSTFIKDGKFEISTPKHMMGIVRLDYHFRCGTEDLLVVEEPGDVYVHIDSVSSGRGTKHNDILQGWKELTFKTQSIRLPIMKKYSEAHNAGDSATEKVLLAKSDSLLLDYLRQTRTMAEKCDEGPLRDFLLERIPPKMTMNKPDGTSEVVKP